MQLLNSLFIYNLNDFLLQTYYSVKYFSSMPLKFCLEGQLGHYLAGLLESDGHITVFNERHHPVTGKKQQPRVEITFSEDDLPLIFKLIQLLGYGNYYKVSKGAYRLVNR